MCSDVSRAVSKLVKELLRTTGSGKARYWVIHGFRINTSGHGFPVSFSLPRVGCKRGGYFSLLFPSQEAETMKDIKLLTYDHKTKVVRI